MEPALLFENKRLILFDLDGTLIDSAPDLAKAVNHMLVQFGRDPYDLHTIHHWVGNGAQMLVKRALHGKRDIEAESIDQGLFEKTLASFMAYYRAHLCEETHTYAHVPQTLQELKARGYTMAIVTNKPTAFVSPILGRLQIAHYFDAYLGGDSLPVKKPDPTPLLHLCRQMESPVLETLMVGDSKNDILAANACGMDSVGVSYGYNYGEDISIYKPTCIIDDFKNLSTILPERASE
jgi:phosphoglycolate phosphatase